jgi:hypothetical protein
MACRTRGSFLDLQRRLAIQLCGLLTGARGAWVSVRSALRLVAKNSQGWALLAVGEGLEHPSPCWLEPAFQEARRGDPTDLYI